MATSTICGMQQAQVSILQKVLKWSPEGWQEWLGDPAMCPSRACRLGGTACPGQWAHWICLLEHLMLHEGSSFQRVLIARRGDRLCSTIDLSRINRLI